MDVNLGESKEVTEELRKGYNSVLFCTMYFKWNVLIWRMNVYGPESVEVTSALDKVTMKLVKLGCQVSRRIRDKGGFTFSINHFMTARDCPVPELEKMPEDKSHHLTDTDVLKIMMLQSEAVARYCKEVSKCCEKHNAMSDTTFLAKVARRFEAIAQVGRGLLTPRDLRPESLPPTPSKREEPASVRVFVPPSLSATPSTATEWRQQFGARLNEVLEFEESRRLTYSTVFVVGLKGLEVLPIIEHHKCIHRDMEQHAEELRIILSVYMGEEPTIRVKEIPHGHEIHGVSKVLEFALQMETQALNGFQQIHRMLCDEKARQAFPYGFDVIEHKVRHMVMDVEKRIAMITVLLGKPPKFD